HGTPGCQWGRKDDYPADDFRRPESQCRHDSASYSVLTRGRAYGTAASRRVARRPRALLPGSSPFTAHLPRGDHVDAGRIALQGHRAGPRHRRKQCRRPIEPRAPDAQDSARGSGMNTNMELDAWRRLWQARGDRLVPADLRDRVERETRRRTIALIAPVLVTTI